MKEKVQLHAVLLAGPNGHGFLDSLCCTDLTAVEQRYTDLERGAKALANPPPIKIITIEATCRERKQVITVHPETPQ